MFTFKLKMYQHVIAVTAWYYIYIQFSEQQMEKAITSVFNLKVKLCLKRQKTTLFLYLLVRPAAYG